MFYSFDNIDEDLYEKTLKEYWNCPEALIEDEEEDEE